jgi:hypothetical protein
MIYTITIPSTNKLSGDPAAPIGNATYQIDWSFLPNDCDFKMSFTFISKQEAAAGASVMNQVYLITSPDLASRLVYSAGKTTTTQSSPDLGYVYPNFAVVGASTYYGFIARATDNNPIYIRGRPTSNQFTVQIYSTDKSFIHNMAADYVLTLTFEKI